ncbi:MAG: iron-containing alcohol dehydrogenase [Clostridia bacterium]|nr:iron-containing alcohol dehydrogenase [Clostridia bacterium]
MLISKFVAPEIIFGQGALSQVGDSAKRLGASRVFLTSDPGVMETGWVDKALWFLKEQGLDYVVWTRLTPNPRDFQVAEGARVYTEHGCDAVLAVGGGSVIDAAKAVAVLATNGGEIQDYEGIDRIGSPLPPIIAVPTTAGSGAEVSQFCVVVDTRRRLKMTIISKSLIPDICIIDPLLLATVSSELTAYTGMDALTHAIEAYSSLAATFLTDVHALRAMNGIARYLPAAVARKDNMEAKTEIAKASLHAGLAFSNAILGLVHAITHQLGGLLDMPHGQANAILLPYVMDFNLPACLDRYCEMAEALGEKTDGQRRLESAAAAIRAVRLLRRQVGIPEKLSQVGLQAEHIPLLSANAVRDACIITNPRDVSVEQVEAILRAAL